MMNIGHRNAEAVQAMLAKMNMRLHASDIGGKSGRTVRLYVDDGRVTVKTVGGSENLL